jgi:hypothetical protein
MTTDEENWLEHSNVSSITKTRCVDRCSCHRKVFSALFSSCAKTLLMICEAFLARSSSDSFGRGLESVQRNTGRKNGSITDCVIIKSHRTNECRSGTTLSFFVERTRTPLQSLLQSRGNTVNIGLCSDAGTIRRRSGFESEVVVTAKLCSAAHEKLTEAWPDAPN